MLLSRLTVYTVMATMGFGLAYCTVPASMFGAAALFILGLVFLVFAFRKANEIERIIYSIALCLPKCPCECDESEDME